MKPSSLTFYILLRARSGKYKFITNESHDFEFFSYIFTVSFSLYTQLIHIANPNINNNIILIKMRLYKPLLIVLTTSLLSVPSTALPQALNTLAAKYPNLRTLSTNSSTYPPLSTSSPPLKASPEP